MRLPTLSALLVILASVLSGCRDVSQPQMRRPLETLPAGPQVMLLTSDLQNTWDRIEAHELGDLLRKVAPARELLERPEVAALATGIRNLEARSGAHLRDDLVLNALGGRAAVALYASGAGSGEHELLLVGELRDPQRFRTALTAVRQQADSMAAHPDSGAARVAELSFADAELDGKPVLRLHGASGPSLVVLQQDRLLLLGTSDDLLRRALAVQAGDSQESALRHPDFAAALAALGMHNLVFLTREAHPSGGSWMAQGFTWDRDGLHFEQMVSRPAAGAGPAGGSSQREKLLGSIPDGVVLAAYWHIFGPGSLREILQPSPAAPEPEPGTDGTASVAPWRRAAPGGAAVAAAGRGRGRGLTVGGLPFLPLGLPRDMDEWAGGEVAAALFGMQPTPVMPVPDLAVVLAVRDLERARRSLQDIEGMLAALPLGKTSRNFVDVSYGGRTFRTLAQPLFDVISPSYLLEDDTMVLTSTRESMQQIIDTRRTGKRNLLGDDSFRRFQNFVPKEASAVVYADQQRLHRAVQQLGRSAGMWGEGVARGVQELESMSALLEHFPAGAAYVERTPALIRVCGWMRESD